MKTQKKKKFKLDELGTFEDCCKATGRDPKAIEKTFKLIGTILPKAVADNKLDIAIEAINNSIPPDWSDSSEWKYYPLFKVVEDKSKPSGFGLSCHAYVRTHTATLVVSRRTFRTIDGLKHAVNKFLDLYEQAYL